MSVCVCLSVCPAISVRISQRIFSKLIVNMLWAMTRILCTLCLCTQRARVRVHVAACTYMCAVGHTWKEYLRITTCFIGYVIFLFTHRAHVYKRARVNHACMCISLDGFSQNLVKNTASHYKLHVHTPGTRV
jgi:hypothetical protein